MLLTESLNICCYECSGLCNNSCDRLCGMQNPSLETQQKLSTLLLHNPVHQSHPIVLVNKKSRNTKAVYIVLKPFASSNSTNALFNCSTGLLSSGAPM